MPLLEIYDLTKRFGGIAAVKNVSLSFEEGEIVGIIGPNAAGKTTLINLISNFFTPDEGRVIFQGRDITGLKPHQIYRLGIGRTFQLPRLFWKMTVLQNMLSVGVQIYSRDEALKKALDLLTFTKLDGLKDEHADNLSFGQQKLLEFGRVLMRSPKLIMLDEPVAGVHPTLVSEICDYIRELRSRGNTFAIIEHNVSVVWDLCERVIVLNNGELMADGTPEEIRTNREVIRAYLGGMA